MPEKNRRSGPVSRVLSPRGPKPTREATIRLGRPSPDGSSGQPGSSGGQPSYAPLFDLAPGGVYLATPVTGDAGALLPHRFTLAAPTVGGSTRPASPRHRGAGRVAWSPRRAVYSLLHLPSGHPDRALPGTLPCGARTFLPPRPKPRPAVAWTTASATQPCTSVEEADQRQKSGGGRRPTAQSSLCITLATTFLQFGHTWTALDCKVSTRYCGGTRVWQVWQILSSTEVSGLPPRCAAVW